MALLKGLNRKESMMKYMGCFVALLFALPVAAAVPAKKVAVVAPKILSGSGETFGGISGSGFTLLDVRKTADRSKKIERVVFDVGNMKGTMMRGWPGYFHAELRDQPQRLILSFSQMPNSHLDSSMLVSRLKNSLAITNSAMSLDPVDNTLNLTFDLKKHTKVRLFQVAGKKTTSKVVVDLLAE